MSSNENQPILRVENLSVALPKGALAQTPLCTTSVFGQNCALDNRFCVFQRR